MYGSIGVLALIALFSFFYYTLYDHEYSQMFLAFLVILTVSLLTIFMATLFEKVFGCCSKTTEDDGPKENTDGNEENDNNEDRDCFGEENEERIPMRTRNRLTN